MQLSLLSPEKKIFEGEARSLQVPGELGLLGVLNKHAPLLTNLVPGVVKIEQEDSQSFYYISGGFLEIQNNVGILLADSAEDPTVMDLSKDAEKAEAIQDKLKSHPSKYEKEESLRSLVELKSRQKAHNKFKK